MKRSLHDVSVLFDDDGKIYAIWGYRGIKMAELNAQVDVEELRRGKQPAHHRRA